MCNKIYSDLLILYCIMSHVSTNISTQSNSCIGVFLILKIRVVFFQERVTVS